MKKTHRGPDEYTDHVNDKLSYGQRVVSEERKALEKRIESNPYCCIDCGVKYLTDKQKEQESVSTFHHGVCCVCSKEKSVTHIRNYSWLREVKQ